ncbi:hypothetical protein EAE96_010655 [Botrytis aclada]|nr:hypothetical protein EAE96_010655 [Botrytis aclada]
MYRTRIPKHARVRYLARRAASCGSRSLYRSLPQQGLVNPYTLASQSPTVPDEGVDISWDEPRGAWTKDSGLVRCFEEEKQIGEMTGEGEECFSAGKVEEENDKENEKENIVWNEPHGTWTNDSALVRRFEEEKQIAEMTGGGEECFSAGKVEEENDNENEKENVDLDEEDLDEEVDIVWDEPHGTWTHDFGLVRRFEEEKQIAEMTGGGKECFSERLN